MTHKWHIVVLSAVVSYGSGLNAMDKQKEVRNLLSCSTEFRNSAAIAIAALNRSAELRQQEKMVQSNMYFAHCGGNTPPEELYRVRSISDYCKPYRYSADYPGS